MVTGGPTTSVSSTSHTRESGGAVHGCSSAIRGSHGVRFMASARAQVLGSPELLMQIMALL
eukprot:33020-Eustigmatos_ZCMA.PRE.1